jgi:hypothetical protein
VTAQSEEVVVDAHPVHAKDLGEHLAEQLFAQVRRAPAGVRRVCGCGQRRAVELAVRGQRQRVENQHRGRHHVTRQARGHVGPQLGGVRSLRSAHGGRVGHQAGVARGVLADDDRGAGDAGVAFEGRLDLARLDPEAADLDLAVGAAQALEHAAGAPACQVAGAVQPVAGDERRRDEPFGGQAGAAQVAAGQLVAREVELSLGAGGDGTQAGVEDVGAGVGEGAADDDGSRVDLGGGGPDGGLGGPVQVHGAHVEGVQPGGEFLGQGLAADEGAHRGGPVARLQQDPPQGRHGLQGGRPAGADQAEEGLRVAHRLVPGEDDGGTGDERQEQFEGGDVEGDRSHGHQPVARAERDAFGGGVQVVGEGLVADDDALGAAGRARGVDDVGGMLRQETGPAGACRRAEAVELVTYRRGVDVQDRCVRRRRYGGCARGAREHAHGPRVGEHVRDALGRVLGVEGQIGAAGLGHGEQRGHQVRAALHHHGHDGLGAHTPAHEQAGQPAGACVEFGVGERVVAVDQGEGVGRAGHLGFEEVRQGGGGDLGGGVVPAVQDLVQFGVVQYRYVAHAGVRVVGEGLDDAGETLGDPLDGPCVEQVGGRDDCAAQPGRCAVRVECLADADFQVVLGGRVPQWHGLGLDPRQSERRLAGVLEHQHDLEQRVPGQGAGRGEFLDQLLERHVLVLERRQARLVHTGEEFAERRVARQVGAHHEGADEEADQVVQGLVAAARVDGADRDVGARAEPGQRHCEGGLQRGEERHALGERDVREAPVHGGGEFEGDGVTPVAEDGRTPPVVRQFQLLRYAGQCPPPVGDLAGEQAVGVAVVAEQFALPQRVVRVLHGQRLPLGRPAPAPGGVRDREVPGQGAHRPAVARDVVDDHDEHVLVGRGREQPGLDGHFGGEIEGVPAGCGDPPVEAGRGDVVRLQVPVQVGGLQDVLVGLAGRDAVDGAQDLVAADHVPQGRVQGRPVHRAGQPLHDAEVVGRVRALQPGDEPQPTLRE